MGRISMFPLGIYSDEQNRDHQTEIVGPLVRLGSYDLQRRATRCPRAIDGHALRSDRDRQTHHRSARTGSGSCPGTEFTKAA